MAVGHADDAPAPPQEGVLAEPLQPFDSNGDGLLTGEEVRLARQSHNRGGRAAEPTERSWRRDLSFLEMEFRQRRQQDFDLDGDGELQKAERNALKAVWRRIAGGYRELHDELTPKYDRNDDGELDEREEAAARPEVTRRRQKLELRYLAEWRDSLKAPASGE